MEDSTDSPDPHVTALAAFRADVDSLRAFQNAAASHAGIGGHRAAFMVTRDRVSGAIVALGNLANRPRLLEVSFEILRAMNPHAARRDWEATLFQSAAAALGRPFVDVERATGPEPARWSDATSLHALGDKLLVLETLRSFCAGWCGPGWAAKELARELGVVWPMTWSAFG